MSEFIDILVQYVNIKYNKLDQLPAGASVSPNYLTLSYPGDPTIENSKHITYFKNDNNYSQRIVEFPYKKVNAMVVCTYNSGKLVIIPKSQEAQFSYRRGPTVPCHILFLLNNGKMFPLLTLDADQYIYDYGEEGCGLHWKPLEEEKVKEELVEEELPDKMTVYI